MAATKDDIKSWFEDGVAKGATHMIVVCDTFDHEDYPVYVREGENAKEKADNYNGRAMQRVMEVYRLTDPMQPQLDAHRVYNV